MVHSAHTLRFQSSLIDFNHPQIMGIVNVSPDSFYDDSSVQTIDHVIEKVQTMLQQGAHIIDLGATSTKPGSKFLNAIDEWNRLEPILNAVIEHFPQALISIDTIHCEVFSKAFQKGACIWNDVSGNGMFQSGAQHIAKEPFVYSCMHMRGTPENMQQMTSYEDLLQEIYAYFAVKIEKLANLGMYDVLIDPGFGFAKQIEQNFLLLKNLALFKNLGKPLMVGISRKSMIYKTIQSTPENALPGTVALHMVALQQGANLLRVHDVKEAVETITLFQQLERV